MADWRQQHYKQSMNSNNQYHPIYPITQYAQYLIQQFHVLLFHSHIQKHLFHSQYSLYPYQHLLPQIVAKLVWQAYLHFKLAPLIFALSSYELNRAIH